uniref:AbrB/MazE/SpoVT family DNA-binding domain-containing protein n=1 Tax=Rheinheimera sp. TaxID=1869214 RepID=UPI00404876EE
MSYQITLVENNLLPLPDKLCAELGINVGDILIFEIADDRTALLAKKHTEQTLDDEQIASARNLARVVSYKTE